MRHHGCFSILCGVRKEAEIFWNDVREGGLNPKMSSILVSHPHHGGDMIRSISRFQMERNGMERIDINVEIPFIIVSHAIMPSPKANRSAGLKLVPIFFSRIKLHIERRLYLIHGSANVPAHSSTSLRNSKISLCSSPSPRYSRKALTLAGFFLALASAALLAALSIFSVMPTA